MKKNAFVPIIKDLADTDLYKITMLQVFLHKFPANDAVTAFLCRNTPAYPLSELAHDLREQLEHLCTLSFTEESLGYIGAKGYIKKDYVDFLRIFRLQMRYIHIKTKGDTLIVEARGPQIHTSLFEIYVLAIINELYFRRMGPTDAILAEGRKRLEAKIAMIEDFHSDVSILARPKLHPFEFFEFGTRRRYSREWQEEVVATLVARLPNYFKGTSNVYLAMKYNIAAMGTMAHEYLQTFQAVGIQLKNFQKAALEAWVQEYRGDLGIALTDVVGMGAFLRDFDLYFAKLFDGLRHDSGEPTYWGEQAIAHYHKMRIDPHTKRLVFSDGLDIPGSLALYDHFANRIMTGFGIGTNLTNDVGLVPLNIVMKLMECNGQPVAKLSDSPGKTLCKDETFLAYLRQQFDMAA